MYLNLPELFLFGIIAQLLFLAVLAGLHGTGRHPANRLLAVLLLGFAGTQLEVFFHNTGMTTRFPNLAYWGTTLGLVQAGAIYLFTQAAMYRDFRLVRRHLVHLGPPLVAALVFWLSYYRHPAPVQLSILSDSQYPGVMNSLVLAIAIHGTMLSYLGATIRTITRFDVELRNLFSDLRNKDLVWLRNLLLAYSAVWLLSLGYCLLAHIFRVTVSHQWLTLASALVGLGILLPMTLLALRQPERFPGISPAQRAVAKATELPSTTKAQDEALTRKLEDLMASERPYLHSNLTVNRLAHLLGVPAKDLSRHLNQVLGRNFYEFVNGYRITEVKRRLADPEEDKTVLDIMYEAGFNSKSVFNTLFRKSTGMTPTRFRQDARSSMD